MPNKDFFSDSSIVTTQPTAIMPYQPNHMNTAMMLAAADPATRKKVMDAVLADNCKLLLSTTALEGAAMLSSIELQLANSLPNGAHRYKAIADAYTAAAINRIGRY